MTPVTTEELDALAERIACLVENPDDVKSTFGRLARPVLRALRWQPTIETERVRKLAQRLTLSESEAVSLQFASIETCARGGGESARGRRAIVAFACSLNAPLEWRAAQLGQARMGRLVDRFGFNLPAASTGGEGTPPSTAAVTVPRGTLVRISDGTATGGIAGTVSTTRLTPLRIPLE